MRYAVETELKWMSAHSRLRASQPSGLGADFLCSSMQARQDRDVVARLYKPLSRQDTYETLLITLDVPC